MSYVLVTGASGGIGEQFARQFAAKNRNLILVARSQDKLGSLAKELSERHGINAQVLPCDLARPEAADEIFEACRNSNWEVDILVNNAGFGMLGPFAQQDAHHVEQMVMLNVVTLTKLTRLFLPAMIEKHLGGIINVASTAAFQPIPTLAAYSATKAYVLSLTEALHGEVTGKGVKVMALCPGPTETAFFERAKSASGIKGNLKISLQPADEVVSLAISRFQKGERVTIPGLLNKFGAYSVSFVPKSVLIKVTEKMFKAGAGI